MDDSEAIYLAMSKGITEKKIERASCKLSE